MANEFSLAVGDGSRRMTYAELADVRGISPASAKRLTQRHRWGRQVGNDGVVRVTVPLSALVNPTKPKANAVTGDTEAMSSATEVTPPATSSNIAADVAGDAAPDDTPATARLAEAIDVLRNQLEVAKQRADRAEAQADQERNRADQAEQRASETIADLRARLATIEARFDASEQERRRVQERLTALLTHRSSASVPAVQPAPPRAPWWQRWVR